MHILVPHKLDAIYKMDILNFAVFIKLINLLKFLASILENVVQG